ncbi:hypothetical protein NEHOM01_2274 [Nematocida homosporus]|uniref:uncharacterized protein n=1 Tax=Nematocida homosporus TaxID=1912981 RepID=UPI00221EC888|nr:uncharacterized protein NEHOM01_2274 [Nematocida homosporus]KAI5187566.1 hypothetical protein NEHOM01_2274 [Nematocida homosporus]
MRYPEVGEKVIVVWGFMILGLLNVCWALKGPTVRPKREIRKDHLLEIHNNGFNNCQRRYKVVERQNAEVMPQVKNKFYFSGQTAKSIFERSSNELQKFLLDCVLNQPKDTPEMPLEYFVSEQKPVEEIKSGDQAISTAPPLNHVKFKIEQMIESWRLDFDLALMKYQTIPVDFCRLINLQYVVLTSSSFDVERNFFRQNQDSGEDCANYTLVCQKLVQELSKCTNIRRIEFRKMILFQPPVYLSSFPNLRQIDFVDAIYQVYTLEHQELQANYRQEETNLIRALSLIRGLARIRFVRSDIKIYTQLNKAYASLGGVEKDLEVIFDSIDIYVVTAFFYYYNMPCKLSVKVQNWTGINFDDPKQSMQQNSLLHMHLGIIPNMHRLQIHYPSNQPIQSLQLLKFIRAPTYIKCAIDLAKYTESFLEDVDIRRNIMYHIENMEVPIEELKFDFFIDLIATKPIAFSSVRSKAWIKLFRQQDTLDFQLNGDFVSTIRWLENNPTKLSWILGIKTLKIQIHQFDGCVNDLARQIRNLFKQPISNMAFEFIEASFPFIAPETKPGQDASVTLHNIATDDTNWLQSIFGVQE